MFNNIKYEKISEAVEEATKQINIAFAKFEQYLKEECLTNMSVETEKKLQDYFINTRELGGIPISKDNCEDLFENWLQALTLKEINDILYVR